MGDWAKLNKCGFIIRTLLMILIIKYILDDVHVIGFVCLLAATDQYSDAL